MATDDDDIGYAVALVSEVLASEHLVHAALARYLPKGMEASHFMVLSFLSLNGERTPAQLARRFNVTKGAMTNTIGKLEVAGYVHIRPDWEDARKKLVGISQSGENAREMAANAVRPLMAELNEKLGAQNIKMALPVLREFRKVISE